MRVAIKRALLDHRPEFPREVVRWLAKPEPPILDSGPIRNANYTEPFKSKVFVEASLSKNAGVEFVNTMFGRERQLEQTEKIMSSIRLWNLRFDANCEEILRNPGGKSAPIIMSAIEIRTTFGLEDIREEYSEESEGQDQSWSISTKRNKGRVKVKAQDDKPTSKGGELVINSNGDPGPDPWDIPVKVNEDVSSAQDHNMSINGGQTHLNSSVAA